VIGPSRQVPRAERVSLLVILGATVALYAAFSVGDHPIAFGVNQLHDLADARLLAQDIGLLAWCAALSILAARKTRGGAWTERSIEAAVALGAFAVFYVLRTNFLNPDGRGFATTFARDVPTRGYFATHDEILELFVHSRAWYYAHRWWGWDVERTYQTLSCAAGAAFIWLLDRFARRQPPTARLIVVAGVLSGGYMQLFFGDVENYTITAAIVMLYMLLASRFLRDEIGLVWPTLALAVAMCFHLLAAWLVPSLLFLFWIHWRRRRAISQLVASTAVAAAVGLGTLTYFNYHGLHWKLLIESFAGHALLFQGVWAGRQPLSYYLAQLNLLFLLCPAVALIVPLAVFMPRPYDDETSFLAIAAGMLLAFQALWKAQLGVYNDWNLFAIGGLCAGLLVWRSLGVHADTGPARRVALALAAVYALHAYAWIAANHAIDR